MATFDGSDLRALRVLKGISSADLADIVGEDVNLILRYERNTNKNPDPETMYLLCQAVGDDRDWQNWMRTEFPKSYGRVHPEPVRYGLQGSIMQLFSEVRDLEDLEREATKDGADGVIDNQKLHDDLLKEITELIQAAQSAKAILEGAIRNGKITESF